MTRGAPDSPAEARPGTRTHFEFMSDDKSKRGGKRGVLGTGRAQKLDKTKDARDAVDENDEQDAEG